jgi:hypothetical protein
MALFPASPLGLRSVGGRIAVGVAAGVDDLGHAGSEVRPEIIEPVLPARPRRRRARARTSLVFVKIEHGPLP